MTSGTLHMKIGSNLGNILLEIAQTNIQNGNSQKAIETYTKSLCGFSEEYAIALLKNEYVLITDEDGISVNMTDQENERKQNQNNIVDWNSWLRDKLDNIKNICDSLFKLEQVFSERLRGSILDYNIIESIYEHFGIEDAKKIGIHNITAKLIAGDWFSNLFGNGENVWNSLCGHVESDEAEKYEYAFYLIVKYVNCIRTLHKEYMAIINSYEFLLTHKFVEHPCFSESIFEQAIHLLCRFSNPNTGYYHPMCNTKLYDYKEQIDDDILSTSLGNEYRKYGTIEKNIMDGYDAGWLSPDGKFYGECGPTSSMIHLRIAENLTKGDLDGDRKLEEEGWIKIHHDEVYGTFIGRKSGPEKDYPYKYAPTDIQIKKVCDYIDKYYGGKLYTMPKIIKIGDPISTYKLRQMDEVMLHNVFN